MGNIGGGEIIVILLVALIFLGPDKLPEVARQIGKVMGEVRKVSAGFQREMQEAMRVPDEPARTPVIEPPTTPVTAAAPVVSVVEGIDADGPFVETSVDTAPDIAPDADAPAPVDAITVETVTSDTGTTDTVTTDTVTTDPVDTVTTDTVTTDPVDTEPAADRVIPSEAPPLPDVAYGGDR